MLYFIHFYFSGATNYGVPATASIETSIAHFNTHYCVYIGIRHNAPTSGQTPKSRGIV